MPEPDTEARVRREVDEQCFADWVQTDIIAEIIFEELESAGHDPTLANAKLVYLDILEDALYDAVRHCLNYNPAFQSKPVRAHPA